MSLTAGVLVLGELGRGARSNLRFEHDSGYVARRDGEIRVDTELLVY
jgi:hypothetical protein